MLEGLLLMATPPTHVPNQSVLFCTHTLEHVDEEMLPKMLHDSFANGVVAFPNDITLLL